MLELKLQSAVLVTTLDSRSSRISKQVYVLFLIGDNCLKMFSRFWSTDRIVVNWCRIPTAVQIGSKFPN